MSDELKGSQTLERAVPGGDYGPQPLDGLMESHGLSNTDLVKAGAVGVTHKMIHRARQGRRLSRKVQVKVVGAFNAALAARSTGAAAPAGNPEPKSEMEAGTTPAFRLPDLFTYDGR